MKKKISLNHSGNKNSIIFGALVAGIGGTYFLISSFAALPVFWLESEDADVSGNAETLSDSSASGESFLKFGGEPAPTDADFVVSPNGNDSNPGNASSPFKTVGRAQQAVRSQASGMSDDLVVYLRGGTYRLGGTLNFDDRDSGQNGHNVVYRAWPGEKPVLTTASKISGWSSAGSGMVKTNIGTGYKTRHLFVNNQRAVRARTGNTSGFTKTSSGYNVGISGMANWGGKKHIEIIGFREWRDYHCGVSSISGGNITVDQPCWEWANLSPAIGKPTYIENAFELLDQPGEWYHDRSSGELFYMPRSGENISGATVWAATGGQIIKGTGVKDFSLEGLTFAYSGWDGPEDSDGYAPIQTNILFSSDSDFRVPGAVHFSQSVRIGVKDNTFTHLGAGGLALDQRTRRVEAIGNKFEDISAYAVSVGEVEDEDETDFNRQHRNVTISNNYITKIGQEFRDSPAIFMGYVRNMLVQHNEIHNIPYSGMTMGWGWGQDSYARNNIISNNHIYNFIKVLTDSAAIYTLSSQPNSEIHDNYIHNNHDRFGCLYPDEGSANMRWHHNVCEDLDQSSYYTKQWIHIWTSTIKNLTVDNNYNDSNTVIENAGTNITLSNNSYISNDNWPSGALQIMDNAGLEPEYDSLKD